MLKAYRIKFLSKSTPVRAYTLFGAVCWAYRLLGGDIDTLLSSFKEGDPPFIISSPFPIAESKGGYSLVFPKPVLEMVEDIKDTDPCDVCGKVNRKPLKKATYVSFGVFVDIVEGKIRYEHQLSNEEVYQETKKVIVHFSDRAHFKDPKALSVRNILNRATMKSENLFTEEYYLFGDRWFLVKFFDESYVNVLEECFKFIEDMGLGANKNLGWGSVRIKELEGFERELNWLGSRIKKDSKTFITLSPVIVGENSIELDKSLYKTEIYKSPMDTTFGEQFIWKKKVMYLTEGSFLTKVNSSSWIGQTKDVGAKMGDLDVKAYQYGFEFPIEVEGQI